MSSSNKQNPKRKKRNTSRKGAATGRPAAKRNANHGAQRPSKNDPANQKSSRPRSHDEPRQGPRLNGDEVWIYGRHAGEAALANPERQIERIMATKNAYARLEEAGLAGRDIVRATLVQIDEIAPHGAVHQGLALIAKKLPTANLADICIDPDDKRPVIVLDQITDPQNIGAIFRSAAAFGARAIVVQDRATPPLSAALAKAAAGAIETIPVVRVVNIARTLEELKELGLFCVGLAGEAQAPISDAPRDQPLALVIGSEGDGLRRLVREKCDLLVKIEIGSAMESLNVSTATAISLYELTKN